MKPEELLFSLDHVGEDLLNEADQSFLVRRRRPRLGAAAAAVLLIALGVGGFFLWKRLQADSPVPPAAGSPTAPETSAAVKVPDSGEALPTFAVGDNYRDRSGWSFDDLDRALAVDQWTLETGAERLPVYERPGRDAAAEAAVSAKEARLTAMLIEAAQRLGAAIPDEIKPLPGEDGQTVRGLEAVTELGVLTVEDSGRTRILFNETHCLSAVVKLELSAGLTQRQIDACYRDAIIEQCGRQVETMLGLPECRAAVCDDYSSLSSAYTAYWLTPLREDPTEQLISRCFESVKLLTLGRSVVGLEWTRLPEAEEAAVPSELRLLGNYPVISAEEARRAALGGYYFSEGAVPSLTEEALAWGQLVYLTEGDHTLLLPFYRFWVPVRTADDDPGRADCVAVLVPAVDSAWLTDFDWITRTPEPTEPTDPTEPPDGLLPILTGQPGEPTVSGPAGTVEALHYMGDCQDPVWADVDGDGQRELVYRCGGPTSGLFTAGLCVYGLAQGWPVLEAAQLYNLTWGELRLTEENGTVQLHYTPHRYDQAVGASVPQAEQLCTVTVRDGALLLNDGALPEGCEPWGGPEWTLFGSSFPALQRRIRGEAAAGGRPEPVLDHWAALVWTEPSAASVPTDSPRVFAAVSDNGVTVTGLLRYEPRSDGGWFCAGQGVEPIETPADLDALAGLSMEELTERLGPCHFDLGSGLYLPCWFTEDCRMLVVHTQSSAELRELSAPAD